jgi:5'-methylthioadenosine phosphorylase
VINMSALPESKLAREAEMAYAMVCMSTDYDCWHAAEEDVSVELVMQNMVANAANAKRFVATVLDELSREENAELVMAGHLEGRTKGGISTGKDGRAKEAVEKLKYLFPCYFD